MAVPGTAIHTSPVVRSGTGTLLIIGAAAWVSAYRGLRNPVTFVILLFSVFVLRFPIGLFVWCSLITVLGDLRRPVLGDERSEARELKFFKGQTPLRQPLFNVISAR